MLTGNLSQGISVHTNSNIMSLIRVFKLGSCYKLQLEQFGTISLSLHFAIYNLSLFQWSYGVLLWELTTLAQTPYANVDPFEMLRYLKAGFRLPQPPNCPDDLFTVMACCWALAPEERPHFSQVVTCLEGFYSTLNAFI